MSLARTLLNGVNESIDITGFECGEVSIESYTLDAACEALVNDIYSVDKAYHIADIIGEVKVIKEGADPEVLLEGMIMSAIEKLKNMFKKFWAKIKAWFDAVRKYVKSFTLDCKNFVKEFRKELEQKKVTGFKYTAYKYTFNVDNQVKSWCATLDTKVTECAAGLAKDADGKRNLSNLVSELGKGGNSAYDANTDAGKNKMKDANALTTGSEYAEEVLKALDVSGATTESELRTELDKLYRDGEEQEQEFEEFESCSVSDMLDFIESFEKKVSDYENDEKKIETDINNVIKALDKIKSTDTGSNDLIVKYANKYSQRATKLLTIRKIFVDAKVSAYREAGKSYRSILGSFLRRKPVKEGAGMDDEEVEEGKCGSKEACAESLLDVAMNLL